jgi:hypothetical protein
MTINPDEEGQLPRQEEKDLIAERAMELARLELEKVAQQITDMLRFGDQGVWERMETVDHILLQARRWLGVWEFYSTFTTVTPVPHPIPDHEDDDKEGERL